MIDQGIPAVLGMRYSVYVVTAAQYIGQLYAALATGRPFGEAASQGRKHLAANPERWVGLEPRPLQDWFVPVIYEAMPMPLLPAASRRRGLALDRRASWTRCRPTPRCGATCPTPASSAATRPCCCSTGPSTATRWCCCTPTPGRAKPPRPWSSPAGTP